MTQYCVRLRFRNTGQISVAKFDSATERELWIAGLDSFAEFLEQWVSNCTCAELPQGCEIHGVAASNARQNEFMRNYK